MPRPTRIGRNRTDEERQCETVGGRAWYLGCS
jgi:hypothetical protein